MNDNQEDKELKEATLLPPGHDGNNVYLKDGEQQTQTDKICQIYDPYMERYLWNPTVTRKTFKKDDFIEALQIDTDRLLHFIDSNMDRRDHHMDGYIRLNLGIIALYGLFTLSKVGFITIIMFYSAIYICSFIICILWYRSIYVILSYNTTYFSAVRQNQKYFPTLTHGYAAQKTLEKVTNMGTGPLYKLTLKFPFIFIGLHTLIYFCSMLLLYFAL